jgi:hypothetical protein
MNLVFRRKTLMQGPFYPGALESWAHMDHRQASAQDTNGKIF